MNCESLNLLFNKALFNLTPYFLRYKSDKSVCFLLSEFIPIIIFVLLLLFDMSISGCLDLY